MSSHNFLTGLTTGFTPVIDAGFSLEDYQPVDLSVRNPALSEKELNSPEAFENYLSEYLQKRGKKIAFGGYDEHRGLYKRSGLFSAVEAEEATRNIHIGLDIWAPAGTAVLSVLPGRIHSFRDNNNFGDYGPTIIVEHEASGKKFHTLYGHLQKQSLKNLEVGQEVDQGERIAALGDASENGNYAPHLHFQIIIDMEGMIGDYPGVTNQQQHHYHLQNCPNPNLLLKMS